jgi:hypothetical protein
VLHKNDCEDIQRESVVPHQLKRHKAISMFKLYGARPLPGQNMMTSNGNMAIDL